MREKERYNTRQITTETEKETDYYIERERDRLLQKQRKIQITIQTGPIPGSESVIIVYVQYC